MLHKLVIASVVLGVAFASPFLPRDDPNVAAARARFIQEYNRLAALAAAAPDVNIIMDDRTHPSIVNNHLQQPQQHRSHLPVIRQQPQHHTQQLPVVHQQQQHQQHQPLSLSQRQQPNPAFNSQFSFSTSLGDNQQFFPQSNFNLGNNQEFFPQSNVIQQTSATRRQHNSGHLESHRGSIAPTTHTFTDSNGRWTGPFADTVPAGVFVNGLPQQVGDTPEVAAAKEAHFRAHALARANNPVF